MEIGPPPTKLRNKIANKTNDYYSGELLNGTSDYDDFKPARFSSSGLSRNRSQRRRNDDRYGKGPANNPFKLSNNYNNAQNDMESANKKAVTNLSTTTAALTIDTPNVNLSGQPMSLYPRRNIGIRGRGRGGNLINRNLNRPTRTPQVPSVVDAGTAVTSPTAASAASSTASATTVPSTPQTNGANVAPASIIPGTNSNTATNLHADEYTYNYNYGDYSGAPIEMNNMTMQTSPTGYYYYSPAQSYVISPDEIKLALRTQIEYYFSEENLQRDFFLRRKMDKDGFLPISLIASFHRVQALTQDVTLVVDALVNSTTVEMVDGIKVRTRNNPEQWPIVSYWNIKIG